MQPDPSKFPDLRQTVLDEVLPAFRASTCPSVPEVEVGAGVDLLIRLLQHRTGDRDLDGVGYDITEGLHRWFQIGKFLKLVDRYEPFTKFLLKVIDPKRFAALESEAGNRLASAKVLKALDLVRNKELSLFADCTWETFPTQALAGKPDFLEHIARTYVYRNVEDHRARTPNSKERGIVVESFCVLLVWCVIKYRDKITEALTLATCTEYLERVRRRHDSVARGYVCLSAEMRTMTEFRVEAPSTQIGGTGAQQEGINAFDIPKAHRVAVLEATPGAGKTTTLKYLAWRQADRLLQQTADLQHIPVFIALKLAVHRGQTIGRAVEDSLRCSHLSNDTIPWNSLLLLVDGLNEVSRPIQASFLSELQDMLNEYQGLRAVLAGRPNALRREIDAQIFILRSLNDDQVLKLLRQKVGDEDTAMACLLDIQKSPFLSSWVRIPLHAEILAKAMKRSGRGGVPGFASTTRDCIRKILIREEDQGLEQTILTTKELLLSRLAFHFKESGQGLLARQSVLSTLAKARAQIGAARIDLPAFLDEVLANGLLRAVEGDAIEFAHELYQDYFAATELEARSGLQVGLGAAIALKRFQDPAWTETIRIFAGLTACAELLLEKGAEQNPWLAWLLLKDATSQNSKLIECVALAAYSECEGDLHEAGRARRASSCFLILADLDRPDLLEQVILRQRSILEPSGLWRLAPAEQEKERRRIQEGFLPLADGLLSILRFASVERSTGRNGRHSAAAKVVLAGLRRIGGARVLCAVLACWEGDKFNPDSVIPGDVLDAIIELGVDGVLDCEVDSMNRTLAACLDLACRAGWRRAFPAYSRVLRLAQYEYVCAIDYDPEEARKWARLAHDAGDVHGGLELGLLMLDDPAREGDTVVGEGLLREAALSLSSARYELGKRLLRGESLVRNEEEGFEHLVLAAESGHSSARLLVNPGLYWLLDDVPASPIRLMPFVRPFVERLKALYPEFPWISMR